MGKCPPLCTCKRHKPSTWKTPCPGWTVTPEELAECFHVAYEALAPLHGYKTREASAVPWDEVPAQNKALMIDVAGRVLRTWFPAHSLDGDR